MPTSAMIPPVRRAAAGASLVVLLVLVTVASVGAWSPAGSRAADDRGRQRWWSGGQHSQVAPPGPAAHGAPIASREEALAAGGRRAPGARSRTVVRHGIDVSHWQGRIDWPRVARSGRVQFVIAKATDGTWMVDPTYARNRRLAHRSGLRFTAYHFANPSRRPGDAEREADWFLRHARLRDSDLLPALDLEEHGGLTPRELERWTLRWLRRVERRLGVKPMVYSSPGFWSGRMGDSRAIARAGFETLWLSHWGVRKPRIPAAGWADEGWSIWQWTETGQIAGIGGPVDRNVYSGPRLERMTIRVLRREGVPDDPRGDRPPRPRPRSRQG